MRQRSDAAHLLLDKHFMTIGLQDAQSAAAHTAALSDPAADAAGRCAHWGQRGRAGSAGPWRRWQRSWMGGAPADREPIGCNLRLWRCLRSRCWGS